MAYGVNMQIGESKYLKEKIDNFKKFPLNKRAEKELKDKQIDNDPYERFLAEVNHSLYDGMVSVFVIELKKNEADMPFPKNWMDQFRGDNQPNFDRKQMDETDLGNFYSVAIPTYHALKKDYKSRSVFQWIFNHKKYVAVRDSYKAVEKMIKSVTGISQEDLDQKYRDLDGLTKTYNFDAGIHKTQRLSREFQVETHHAKGVEPKLQRDSVGIQQIPRLAQWEIDAINNHEELMREPLHEPLPAEKNPTKLKPGQHLADEKYMMPGYVPTIETAEKDYEECKKINEALSQFEQEIGQDGKTVFVSKDGHNRMSQFDMRMAKSILASTIDRCDTIRTLLSGWEPTNEQSKKTVETMIKTWNTMEELNPARRTLRDRESDKIYQPPSIIIDSKLDVVKEISEEEERDLDTSVISNNSNDAMSIDDDKSVFEESERISIQVDLEERKTDISRSVQQRRMSVPTKQNNL